MTLSARPRAVVTGAGSGLGRAFCLELVARGAHTLAADVNLDAAKETVRLVEQAGGKAIATKCDVSRADEVERIAVQADAELGGADLVVNNAGVAVGGPMESIPLADWEWIMGVNLWGVIHGCRAFIPRFKKLGRGNIVNVASTAGLIAGPELGPYNVTKAGVVALSETLANELRASGIGVTVLCPTFFKTNIARSARSHGPINADFVEKLMTKTEIQAPEVARFALDAADAGRLFALPHRDGRWAWRAKRVDPERFYASLVPTFAARMKKGATTG